MVKLGVCYNLFDCEELLPASIRSVRDGGVEFVCVVYQLMSNFDQPSHPILEETLNKMCEEGLIDLLVPYSPSIFSVGQRQSMLSERHSGNEKPEDIQSQFFNELKKREIGRVCCRDAGCTHFMSMDADEFYIPSQLKWAMRIMNNGDFEGSAVRMRTYLKYPRIELQPPDSMNWCSFIFKIKDIMPFKLLAPCPVMVDPTRRIENVSDLFLFDKDDVEMHHMSLIRADMKLKLENVSNRANLAEHCDRFLKEYETWTPKNNNRPIHPHPVIGRQFTHTKVKEFDEFQIPLMNDICCLCYMQANGVVKSDTKAKKKGKQVLCEFVHKYKCDCGRVYCCKEHQDRDWREFGHSEKCAEV